MLRRDLANIVVDIATYINGYTKDVSMMDLLSSTDKAVSINLCVGSTASVSASTGSAFTVNDIAGFQLFYSQNGNKVAGPAHGLIDTSCTEQNFPADRPSAVSFYADPVHAQLQGIKMSFDVAGQASPTIISAGPVD